MKKLFLIDATYELFRAYFGAPERKSPGGREAGAVFGLLTSLMSLIRKEKVVYIASATDHVIESFRNDLFPGYKTGEGMPPNLVSQFRPAEHAMRALGLVVWPMVEFEADDALATAASTFATLVDQVVICSPDKDLMQCANDRVVCLDRRRNLTYGPSEVRAKFGIDPSSIPDYLALVGDTADGIPGIPGWGAKTASTMLARFGTIEKFPRNRSSWPSQLRGIDRLAESLFARENDVKLYRRLAILRRDVPLKQSLEDLRYSGVSQNWERFCKRWGFDELIDADLPSTL